MGAFFQISDYVTVESVDADTSKITLIVPKDITDDVLLFLDYLFFAARWVRMRQKCAHANYTVRFRNS